MSSIHSDIPPAESRARASWREDSHKDPDELEREIDETRAGVQATLDALERKLSPEHLLDITLGRMREHGGELAGNLGHSVKENPVPMLLTSIGIAWMMMTGRRDGDGTPPHTGDGGRLRERLGHSRDTVAHAAQSVRSSTGRAASRARSGVDYLLHEQPLVLGAIGIAAGALIGAALPSSEEEDRLIGEASDRTVDKAKHAGREGYQEVRRRAAEAAERAKRRLSESAGSESEATRGRRRDYDKPEDYGRAAERGAEKQVMDGVDRGSSDSQTFRQPGASKANETPPL